MSAQMRNAQKFADNMPSWMVQKPQNHPSLEREALHNQRRLHKPKGVLTEQDIADLRIPADDVQPPCGHFRPAPSHIKMWMADGFRPWCEHCNKLTGKNIIRRGKELSGWYKYRMSQLQQQEKNAENGDAKIPDDPWKTTDNNSWPAGVRYDQLQGEPEDRDHMVWRPERNPPEYRVSSMFSNAARLDADSRRGMQEQRQHSGNFPSYTREYDPVIAHGGRAVEMENDIREIMEADSGTEEELFDTVENTVEEESWEKDRMQGIVLNVLDEQLPTNDEISSDSEYRRAIRDNPLPMPVRPRVDPSARNIQVLYPNDEHGGRRNLLADPLPGRNPFFHHQQQPQHQQPHLEERNTNSPKKTGGKSWTSLLNPFKSAADKHHNSYLQHQQQQMSQHPPSYHQSQQMAAAGGGGGVRYSSTFDPQAHEQDMEHLIQQTYQHRISERQPVQLPNGGLRHQQRENSTNVRASQHPPPPHYGF